MTKLMYCLLLSCFGVLYGCQDETVYEDDCKPLLDKTVSYVGDVYYPHIEKDRMDVEVQRLIVSESDKLSAMYLNLSSCYTKHIKFSRSDNDKAKIFLERREWVNDLGKFSAHVSALKGYFIDEGFKDNSELDVEHMFYVEYLESISYRF